MSASGPRIACQKQQRLLTTSPRPVDPDDLARILTRSVTLW
jgi:hypothetical protein